MLSRLKRVVAWVSPGLNRVLGKVISERAPVRRTPATHGYIKCRVKQSLDGQQRFISLELKPDFSAGMEGDMKNWIDLDLASAERLRDALDSCIRELKGK